MRTWIMTLALLPAALLAQARQGPAWWESPWWNSPLVQNLDLNEAQQKEIRATVREYRGHLMDLREAVQRADSDLQVALDQSPLDQRKANDAIEHLATARGEMTRTISQMTLRLRTILTDEQWQELQRRQEERRQGAMGRGKGGRFGPPPAAATQQR
ncbi:MAG TPA: periplasmic heavy metal sensor [Bryobacteraceae bacterium]|nr:periplasmic heavy metal sensor [Bryobacteraceae bacterium]